MKWSIHLFQRFLLFVTKTKKKMFSNRTSIRLSHVCYVSPRINKWRSAQHHWNAWSNFLTTRHTPLSRWKRMYWEQLLHYWMIRNGLSERRQSCAQIFGIWWVELITKYIWAGRPMLLLVYVKEKILSPQNEKISNLYQFIIHRKKNQREIHLKICDVKG